MKRPNPDIPPEIRSKDNDKKFKGKTGLGEFSIWAIGITDGERKKIGNQRTNRNNFYWKNT